MFVDSHCHLDRLELKHYEGDLAAALAAARAEGVSHFLTVSVDLADLPALLVIAEAHADVSLSVGTHPSDVPTDQEPSVELLCQLAQHPKVVAIGETGLDYYYTADHAIAQQASFIAHIHASKQTNKPLIVHTRDARADTIRILRAEKAEKGVLHCFTEDWDTAEAAMELGFYISLSGIVSFSSAKELREVAKRLPLERLLIETDSPYLAPVPCRGNTTDPRCLPAVATALVGVGELSL